MRMSHRAALLAALAALTFTATASAASLEQRAYQAGLAAYVYGYPPVISGLTANKIPLQTLVSVDNISSPENRVTVLPNADRAYTGASLALKDQPLVLHVPAITGRYYVFELLDAYTN